MCIVVGEHRVSLITPVGAAGYDGYPPERAGGRLFAQKEEVWVCALLRAGHRTIYIRCTYGNFGREITKYNAYIKITPRNYTTIKIKIKNHTKKSPNTHTRRMYTRFWPNQNQKPHQEITKYTHTRSMYTRFWPP